jgi:hypothetical protein
MNRSATISMQSIPKSVYSASYSGIRSSCISC